MNQLIRHDIGRDRMYEIWHRAEGNMILYVHRGIGSIVTPEIVYPLQPGCLCFIGAEILHHTLPNLNHVYDRSKIFVDDETLKKISAILNLSISPHSISYKVIDDDIEPVFALAEKYGLIGGYLQLLQLLCSHSAPPIVTRVKKSPIDQGISYIQENAHRPITIDEICQAVHASKFHFCRTFKERTGNTVMRYILKTRINMACLLLEQGNDSVSLISEKCGFSSPSRFSRAFKDETGVSPIQYKKQTR